MPDCFHQANLSPGNTIQQKAKVRAINKKIKRLSIYVNVQGCTQLLIVKFYILSHTINNLC